MYSYIRFPKERNEIFMEKGQMKNIVVLKNLPSNLIEEAFVIVKSKKVARCLENLDNKSKANEDFEKKDDYIIREAESVLFNCANLVEKKDVKKEDSLWKKKYKITLMYGIFVSLSLIVAIIYWDIKKYIPIEY